MIETIIQQQPTITWMLRAEREGAADFFASIGFTPSTVAMERKRTR